MALNLHLLRIFMTVVDEKSFSAAAAALFISQPAVSKSVQELEQQLGLTLIDRSRRQIDLTEAGSILYEHAQRLFAVERAAEKSIAELHGLERGHLVIGASHTTGTYLLPPLLHQFHQLHPKITLSLQIKNTRDVIHDLQAQSLDIAFVEGPVDANGELDVIAWRADHLVCIAPPNHPLTMKQSVRIEEVLAYPYVQRDIGSGTRDFVEQYFKSNDLRYSVGIELSSNQVVKQAVIAGLGISIVSEATIELERNAGAIAVLEVAGFQLYRSLSHITMRNRPKSCALNAFLTLLLPKNHE